MINEEFVNEADEATNMITSIGRMNKQFDLYIKRKNFKSAGEQAGALSKAFAAFEEFVANNRD